MSEIIILCHLENLVPYNVTGKKAFSLNISVAAGESTPITDEKVKALLRPWLAKHIERVNIFVVGDGTMIPNVPVEKQFWRERLINHNPDGTSNTFKTRKSLIAELDKEFGKCASTTNAPNCFVWNRAKTEEVTEAAQKPWHIFVGQTAQFPAPVPQLLNLSLIFYVPEAQVTGKKIIAAPILDFDFPKDENQPQGEKITFKIAPETDLAIDPRPISNMPERTTVKIWNYKNISGDFPLPVRAYIEECGLRVETGKPFLNLQTLWVENPQPSNANFDEDWRVMLENRMADAFDLSQRIIEHLRSEYTRVGSVDSLYKSLPTYRKMFLASLRDIAGVGITRGPDNQSLLESVLKKTLTDDQSIKIKIAVRIKFGGDNEGGLKNWAEFIRAKLPALSKITVLTNFDEILTIPNSITELEQLHQAVLDPANLAILIREQWREIFNVEAVKPALQELAKVVDSLDLSEINLRRALALENLGRFWKSFIASGLTDERGKLHIKENFSCYFQAYSLLRFQNDISLVSDSCPNLSALNLDASPPFKVSDVENIAKKLLADVKAWSDRFAEKLLPPAIKDAAQIPNKETSTETPHAISIMVDKVADESAQDVLSSISGVGVLMREGSGGWKCLNMADAKIKKETVSLFPEPVLVPLRLNYMNELRQAMVSYNNHPLAAKSPVAQMTRVRPESADTGIWESLISYLYSKHGDAKLSALKFGRSYQIVPFIIGNAGIIPNELSRKKNAAQEEIFSPGDIDLAGFNPAQSRIRKIAYQRRVKVGHIRAFNDADGNCLNLPKIPEDVYPRLRDLKLDDTAKSHEHPLILLAPFPAWEKKGAIQTFNFKLRLPATDINTWDRWVARGEIYGETINDTGTVKLKDLRVGVWADYHTRHDRTRNNQGCKPVLQNDDATLDDPALAPHLVAELFKFVSGAWSQIGVAVPLNVTRNSLAKSITAAQSQSVSVNCVSTLENVQKIEASGDKKTLTVTVKKGELYKLKISCCLPTAYYGASTAADIKPFARIYEDTPFETTTIDGAIFNKISPFETFIEVATDEIAPSNISALITPKFHEQMKFSENGVESFADLMEVRFLRDKVNRVDEEFPYIYKAELQRQVWRWQGRETNPHPQILEEKPTAAAITRWEVKEYGNRFDLDHTIMNMDSRVSETGSAPNAKKATGSRIFSYSEYLTGEKAKKEELRALHYRFRVTVHSRYAGIMPAGGLFVDKWVSEFVPCRVKAPIKVPKPKLIFPLTQSFGSPSSGTAGLLVVLDEPWYEVGGIGESLGAEVIRTPDPKNIPDKPNLATDKFYFEIGADPIVSEQALNVGSPEKITVSFDENKTSQIRGPVGHTFDRSSDAPLFVSTSFIIPAPSIIKDPVSAPGAAFGAWGMCKLRLRRVIHVKPKPVTREGEKTVSLKSEFTDPFWVQYLPEFSLFNINGDFSNLQLKISPNSNSLQAEVVDSGNQNVKLEAGKTDPNGKNLFELYMVLTREVFDATGRSDQEVYVGVLAQSGNIWQTADDSGIFNDETFPDNAAKQRKLDSIKFRARIIEIQRRKNGNTAFMNADKLWEHLFEPHIQDKDRCRIVRISEPLGSGATFEKC